MGKNRTTTFSVVFFRLLLVLGRMFTARVGITHRRRPSVPRPWVQKKRFLEFSQLNVSSLRRGHANLLCIVPNLYGENDRNRTRHQSYQTNTYSYLRLECTWYQVLYQYSTRSLQFIILYGKKNPNPSMMRYLLLFSHHARARSGDSNGESKNDEISKQFRVGEPD